EIVATLAPIPLLLFSMFVLEPYWGETYRVNNGSFYFTVFGSSVFWMLTAWLSQPTDKEQLIAFRNRIQPLGFWQLPDEPKPEQKPKENLRPLIAMWLLSI
ncbi:hypothetical protein RZS08_61240, partial [Arthrospira platensis SPKY1]|nr:hypothetical protein [Arthrospira platensis SPKY1]